MISDVKQAGAFHRGGCLVDCSLDNRHLVAGWLPQVVLYDYYQFRSALCAPSVAHSTSSFHISHFN